MADRLAQTRSAVLLVAALVSIAACQAEESAGTSAPQASISAGTTPTPSSESAPIAFASDRYAYAVDLPSGWYVHSEGAGVWTPEELGYIGPGTDAFELDYEGRGTVANFPGITYGLYVSAGPIARGTTLEEWTATIAETTDRESSCHGDPGRQHVTVDGEPADLLIYDRTDCEHDHHVMIVSVLHAEMGYSVVWLAPRGEADARRATFDEILASFRFTQ